METFSNPENTFPISFTGFQIVGFHGTSAASSMTIESNGFLPRKALLDSDHTELIETANSLGIDTGSYRQWLGMRSVTFTREQAAALEHIRKGYAGGQGLENILSVAREVVRRGDDHQKRVADLAISQLEVARKSPPVIYAVDLSGSGQRLVTDNRQPLYYIYWPTELPLPTASEVGPDRLIARLVDGNNHI
jgi:hypothetical protein